MSVACAASAALSVVAASVVVPLLTPSQVALVALFVGVGKSSAAAAAAAALFEGGRGVMSAAALFEERGLKEAVMECEMECGALEWLNKKLPGAPAFMGCVIVPLVALRK